MAFPYTAVLQNGAVCPPVCPRPVRAHNGKL